jgi:Fe-S-cluster-containing dehydrogenase component/CRP-like cAMP-binding protein
MSSQIRKVPRPRRWDEPFDPRMESVDLAPILARAPFDQVDPSAFPAAVPLEGILRNDARIRRFGAGDLVCARGEYGNSAFFVLDGAVSVIVGEGLPETTLGRGAPRRMGWLQALKQLRSDRLVPEMRAPEARPEALARLRAPEEGPLRLADPNKVLVDYDSVKLTTGQVFGEIAALARVPRNATVMVAQQAELLEIRWQGLRDMRRHSRTFRSFIDGLYRTRSLLALLAETPLLRDLEESVRMEIARHALFESYGEFEWFNEYQRDRQRPPAERIAAEPLIAEQGSYADGILLVSGGFARVTRRLHDGYKTVGLLRRGDVFGAEEALAGGHVLHHGLRALGYVDLVRLPLRVLEEHVLPRLGAVARQGSGLQGAGIDQGLLEFFVENRFINGTQAMVVDLDRCVRCDDCVRACSTAHQGNPRFLREGQTLDRFMVAEACMHCTDPVCMIGCPTGAIHRDRDSGMIIIADPICIGCGTCAGSCPFHAIRMVETRDSQGEILVDNAGVALQKATKCDLCLGQPVAAQCERACPHDALKRVDMRDLKALDQWLQR